MILRPYPSYSGWAAELKHLIAIIPVKVYDPYSISFGPVGRKIATSNPTILLFRESIWFCMCQVSHANRSIQHQTSHA